MRHFRNFKAAVLRIYSQVVSFLLPLVLCLLYGYPSLADDSIQNIGTLESLVSYCLTHATDTSISESEMNYQKTVSHVAESQRWMPQIDIYSSMQTYQYDQSRIARAGGFITNSGTNPVFGASVSYDLSKLIGPETQIAKEQEEHSRLKDVISKRNIVRMVKKNYYLFVSVEQEIASLESLLHYYGKIGGLLTRQSSLGINNEIESQQYKIQKGFLESDLAAKKTELDSIFSTFTTLMNSPREMVKTTIERLPREKLHRAITEEKLAEILARDDKEMIESLSADYSLAKAELDTFKSYPLPVVYLRTIRQNPSMPSFQGPSQMAEVGLSLNVTSFFTRREQKQEFEDNLNKAVSLRQKNLLDYRNSIRLTVDQMKHQLEQEKALQHLRKDLDQTLQRSFSYYTQKRMDTLTILDLAQKSLLAAQRSELSTFQIQSLDAELEYLVGAH
jgi:outer membrane protein TolC